jgi:hypothetical protein
MERRWLSGMGHGGDFYLFSLVQNPPLIHADEPAALHFSCNKWVYDFFGRIE